MPQALPGYAVTLYADGLENPRLIRTAPNGDLVRGRDRSRPHSACCAAGRGRQPQEIEVFAADLNRPFGIAFYPPGHESAVRVRRQHRLRGSLPLQIGDLRRAVRRRRPICRSGRSRRWPLDP